MSRVTPTLALTAILALGGCSSPPSLEDGFDSPDPAAKLHAVPKAVAERDAAAFPRLVELLESDDPAVRMLSIRALERLTGQTLGYEHAGTAGARAQAVARWKAWLADQPNSTAPTAEQVSSPSPAAPSE